MRHSVLQNAQQGLAALIIKQVTSTTDQMFNNGNNICIKTALSLWMRLGLFQPVGSQTEWG